MAQRTPQAGPSPRHPSAEGPDYRPGTSIRLAYTGLAVYICRLYVYGLIRQADVCAQEPRRSRGSYGGGGNRGPAGNPQGALAEYREAARLKPNDPATRYLLFRLYKKAGETRAAAAELEMHQKLRQIYGSKE